MVVMNARRARERNDLESTRQPAVKVLFMMVLAVAVLLAPSASSAEIRVVDPVNGNDENPGTPDQPWETLLRASAAAVAGDEVIVKPGTYIEYINPHNNGNTEDGPIIFRSEHPHEAHITGLIDLDKVADGDDWYEAWPELPEGVWKRPLRRWNLCEAYRDGERMPGPIDEPNWNKPGQGMSYVDTEERMLYVWMEEETTPYDFTDWQISGADGILITREHIVVEGFEVSRFGKSGITVHGTQEAEVLNNLCHDNGRSGIVINWSNHVLAEGNEAHHNGYGIGWSSGISVYEATGADIRIVGNVSHHNVDKSWIRSDGNGFILDKSRTPNAGAVFVNNIAYANGGSGFRIYACNNGKVINNTSLFNQLDTEQFLPGEMHLGDIDGEPIDNIEVVNNIFLARPGKAPLTFLLDVLPENWTMDYNIYYREGGDPQVVFIEGVGMIGLGTFTARTGQEENSLVADPLLDDDYHLPPDSPAIDAGMDRPQITEDFEGDPRPLGEGYDIGADEFVPPGSCFVGTSLED